MDNQSNNYIACPNCRNQVPYGSVCCNVCGYRFQYQMQPQQQYPQQNTKRKDSPLSIVAGIFSLLGILSYFIFAIIGLIIAIVDLAVSQSRTNDNQKHECSWFAIIFAIISFVILIVSTIH